MLVAGPVSALGSSGTAARSSASASAEETLGADSSSDSCLAHAASAENASRAPRPVVMTRQGLHRALGMNCALRRHEARECAWHFATPGSKFALLTDVFARCAASNELVEWYTATHAEWTVPGARGCRARIAR